MAIYFPQDINLFLSVYVICNPNLRTVINMYVNKIFDFQKWSVNENLN